MNDRNVYSDLRRALVRERKYVDHMKLPEFASLRENYFVQAGSFLGRELADYHQILTHNGALDFVQYGLDQPQPNLTIVDLGCGAGYVLCDLREYFPKANLVGFDIQDQTRTAQRRFICHFWRRLH
ncbi:class I SAM-dependent methyltransferase [Candidatus Curtissbacteria bacterium]|nr:class I SAM-dependent methyltransferase [Candidatus Curtissbacteria bacterium]